MDDSGFDSFENFKLYFSVFRENPNDDGMLNKLKAKLDKTHKVLKDRIVIYLEEGNLDKNPMPVMVRLAQRAGRGHVVIINTRKEMWFKC